MKPLLALLLAAGLSACALGPAKYDPTEVASYIEVWQWGQRLREGCGDKEREQHAVAGIILSMERLALLTKYGPDDDSRSIFAATAKVVTQVTAGGSRMFCEEAAANAKAAAERALQAIGRRPR